MNFNMKNGDKGRQQACESFALLAGGLAHDYNNMLTAMLGNIELILCDDIPDSVRDTAKDIKIIMLKAATLVRRMLSYASHSEPQNERVDLNDLVRDIVRIMRRAIPENAVVSIEPPERIPVIWVDAAMFWQVVMNLIINACDSLEGNVGCVKVAVKHQRMTASALSDFNSSSPLIPGDYVQFSVADTGCGMDEETKARIFEPLFTTKTKGNGLGLPSVSSIVNNYGGGIRVNSVKGRGTTFSIIVPAFHSENGELLFSDGLGSELSPEEAKKFSTYSRTSDNAQSVTPPTDSSQPTSPTPAVSTTPSAHPKRPDGKHSILVVDDDASIVTLLKIILQKTNLYTVLTAHSGEEGLAIFQQDPSAINLCLVDASMGAGMNGLDLCAAIRTQNATIPLILMSAYRAKEMSARMATSGVTAFLPKPFRGADVLDLCSKCLTAASNE